MPNLLAFIDSHKNNKVMYGRLTKGWKPIRNIRSKYKILLAAEDLQPKLPTAKTQISFLSQLSNKVASSKGLAINTLKGNITVGQKY